MRLPALDRFAAGAVLGLRRFPLVLAAATLAAIAGFGLAGADRPDPWERLLYVASLGIPLFLAVDLRAERGAARPVVRWLAAAAATTLLVLLWVVRPEWPDRQAVLRYVQLSAGLHLLVAVAPYLAVREPNGFWQFNKSLFLRFLTAAVFSVVLFGGLAIALVALERLFGLDVEPEWYGRLWFVVAFLFNTWYFLAGVPEDFGALERETDYPVVLKVFSQFILVPIVAVYLAILTVYLGKVLVTRAWPSGWIGYLVSSVAVLGILSRLLVHPVEDRAENRWVRGYARGFHLLLLPAVGMLLLAAGKRIGQYGITEPRYFLVVLALWLAAISLYFGLTGSRRIKLIPATLCLVAFATFGGPWGAYSVARRSQVDRLETLLERHGMRVDGQVRAPTAAVPFEDRREMSAVVRYLVAVHGPGSLRPFGDRVLSAARGADSIRVVDERRYVDRAARDVVAVLGVPYVATRSGGARERFRYSAGPGASAVRISDYDVAIRAAGEAGRADTVVLDTLFLVVDLAPDSAALRIRDAGGDTALVPLGPVVERARRAAPPADERRSAVPADSLHAVLRGRGFRGEAWFTELEGQRGPPADTAGSMPVIRVVSWAVELFLADGSGE